MNTNICAYLKTALISLTAILLLGCQTNPASHLRPKTIYNIGATDVFVSIAQNEIILEQNKGVGGPPVPPVAILPVLAIVAVILIVKALSKNEGDSPEDRLQTIIASLAEVDVKQLFQPSLQTKLAEISWLNVKSITYNTDEDSDKKLKQAHFTGSTAEAVLFIDLSYSLKSDYSALKAYANLTLIPRNHGSQEDFFNPKATKKMTPRQLSRSLKKGPHKDGSVFQELMFREEALPGTRRGKPEKNSKYLKNNVEITRETLTILAQSLVEEIVSNIQQNGVEISAEYKKDPNS